MSYNFKQEWINEMAKIVKMRYPKVNRIEIDKKLSKIYDERIKDEEVQLIDTYKNVTYVSSKLNLIEYCEKTKPLFAGNGTLFDPKGRNPAVNLLHKFKKRRTAYKAEMKKHPPDSFEFYMNNLYQMNEKVKMNAWYGICGAPTSIFFNLECATGRIYAHLL